MKLYFAGSEPKIVVKMLIKNKVESCMYSYYYIRDSNGKKFDYLQKYFKNIFVDSGGFSARIKGVNIKLKNNKINLVYANLDVKLTKDTLANQQYLERKGLTPLPVYHASEFFQGNRKLFFDYMKKYDYIAVGGVSGSGYGDEVIKKYFSFIFNATKNKRKIHGFGITSLKFLNKYPFHSVDSTSWNQGMLYGALCQWDSKKLNFDKNHYTKKEKSMQISMSIKELKDYKKRAWYNIGEYQKMELAVTRIWEARGVKV